MEKDRGFKIMAVIALLIAVVGVSVGFAAFTTTLTINNSTATIPAGSSDLANVKFTNSEITTAGASGTAVGAVNNQTWAASTVVFSSTVRTVKFTATITNSSSYGVYLNSMTAASGAKISCTGSTVSSDILSTYCGATTATYTFSKGGTVTCNTTNCTSTVTAAKQAYTIAASGTATVTLEVSTASTTTSSALPDGAISITVPGITMGYTTAKPSS